MALFQSPAFILQMHSLPLPSGKMAFAKESGWELL